MATARILASGTLAACLILALAHASAGLELPERYLWMQTKLYTAQYGNLLYRNIIKPFFDDSGMVQHDTDPETLLELFKTNARKGQFEAGSRPLMQLADLANRHKPCPEGGINVFITVVEILQSRKNLKNSQVLMSYLDHFAPGKFEACAPKAKNSIGAQLEKNRKRLVAVEGFFKRLLSLPADASDEDLYNKAKVANPSDRQFDLGPLAEMVRETDGREHPSWQLADGLMQNYCRFLRVNFSDDLDVLNLATHLNSGKDFIGDEMPIKKLNELHRFCLDFLKNRKDLEKNFKRKY